MPHDLTDPRANQFLQTACDWEHPLISKQGAATNQLSEGQIGKKRVKPNCRIWDMTPNTRNVIDPHSQDTAEYSTADLPWSLQERDRTDHTLLCQRRWRRRSVGSTPPRLTSNELSVKAQGWQTTCIPYCVLLAATQYHSQGDDLRKEGKGKHKYVNNVPREAIY